MADVHERFDTATTNIGAYTVHLGGRYIGRLVFKFPREGAGRVHCFAQVWGLAMERGWAGGGGYDKRSAAARSAVKSITVEDGADPEATKHLKVWQEQLAGYDGDTWNAALERAGYQVHAVC